MSILSTVAAIALGAAPLVLDNGVVRVDVDPSVFAIRFVGFSHGANFVAPLEIADTVPAGDWVDAGGLSTDLIPYAGKDAAIRRGPAEVLEHRPDYLSMLGPASESTGIRLKKEIQLDKAAARARFRVTAQCVAAESVRYAIRNTARLAPRCTVRVERTDGDIRILAGADTIFPAVVKSRRFWLMPVPPTSELRGVVLGSVAPAASIATDAGAWLRRIVDPPTDTGTAPNDSLFLCVLDDTTQSYGAALQGGVAELKPGELMTLEEEWVFDKRGRN